MPGSPPGSGARRQTPSRQVVSRQVVSRQVVRGQVVRGQVVSQAPSRQASKISPGSAGSMASVARCGVGAQLGLPSGSDPLAAVPRNAIYLTSASSRSGSLAISPGSSNARTSSRSLHPRSVADRQAGLFSRRGTRPPRGPVSEAWRAMVRGRSSPPRSRARGCGII